MKRVLGTMCMAAVCGAAAVAAQSGYDKPQTDKMKEGTVMVTGCVADKSTGGRYMLTNAMKSTGTGQMPDKDKMATEKPGTEKGTGMTHAMTYELSGGDNLQAHVGHKVEITGMLDKADWDRMKKMDRMDKTEKMDDRAMADKNMKAMRLEVKSVRMISAVCP